MAQAARFEEYGGIDARLPEMVAGQGAARFYLQVEEDNQAARAVYAHAGFTRSHGYHYRIAP